MSSLNKWLGLGNLTADPQREQFGRGSAVIFTMAINERWTTDEGREGSTIFVRVFAPGNLGENVMQFLTKGRQVLVEGRLRIEGYEDQNHVKHHRPVIRAESIQFLGKENEPAKNPSLPSR